MSTSALSPGLSPERGDRSRAAASSPHFGLPSDLRAFRQDVRRRRPPVPEVTDRAPAETAPPAVPPVLVVSPSGPADCRSVQEAVRRAAPGTRILFGNNEAGLPMFSGGRLTVGAVIDDCRNHAIEASAFAFGDRGADFQAASNASFGQ